MPTLPTFANFSLLFTVFHILSRPLPNMICSPQLFGAILDSYPHVTRFPSSSTNSRSCLMNSWYDKECKFHHRQLHCTLLHDPCLLPPLEDPIIPSFIVRNISSFFRRDMNYMTLLHPPKSFWRTLFLDYSSSLLTLTPIPFHPYNHTLQCPQATSCCCHLPHPHATCFSI
jgi:hypothetical protein